MYRIMPMSREGCGLMCMIELLHEHMAESYTVPKAFSIEVKFIVIGL